MALGELQQGRYHNLRLLGSGGMGEVYLMQDMRVNRQVAIKIIRSEGDAYASSTTSAEATRLFQREARAIAALEHPNILPLYDFGEETVDGATITYMVMPYCADGSIASWLKLRGNTNLLSPQNISYLVDQAAEALQYAHDHQVIHLDVKPSNFLLRTSKKGPNRPTLLLADFGIARSFTTVASSSRTIRGTPTSMAPEQWSSTPVPATDQYALAVMTYELLTGRPPFIGSMEQLMYQHFTVEPDPPSAFNPRLTQEIDAVLLRALAKKPEDRFPSIVEFSDALGSAVAALPVESTDTSEQLGANGSDIYSTLFISQSEADTGISRLITLPGGRKIEVPIPAGTRNGEIIRVNEQDETISPAGNLQLTVAIKQPEKSQGTPLLVSTPGGASNPITPVLKAPNMSNLDANLPTVASSNPALRVTDSPTPVQPPAVKRSPIQRFAAIGIIVVLILLLALVSLLYFTSHSSPTTSAQATPTATHGGVTPTPTFTATPVPKNGLYIADTYNGSMQDQTTNQQTNLIVHIVQTRGNGTLSGTVTFKTANNPVYPLHGTVDLQGNFSFTVDQPAGQKPLYFSGSTQQQGGVVLKGNYCSSNTNFCPSYTGFFTVGPGY